MLALAGLSDCTNDEPSVEPEGFEAMTEVDRRDPYVDSPSRFGIVRLHAGFSPDPRVVDGTAVGEMLATSIHRKCKGWIAEMPDYLLRAETAFLQLHVLGRSKGDVLLVVRTPDGTVLCNDNRQGTKDPMIRSAFPIGTSQVWVGVKTQEATVPYRLAFSEVKWRSSVIPLPESD